MRHFRYPPKFGFFQRSDFLFPWVSDGYFRMLIRYLYGKYLDELYVPRGSKVYVKDKTVILSVNNTGSVCRGMQEKYLNL
jgi:hypothetical protein